MQAPPYSSGSERYKRMRGSSEVVLVVKNLPANVGDTRDTVSITGSGRSPGVGNGTPLQCGCLENSRGRGVRESDVTEQLNN